MVMITARTTNSAERNWCLPAHCDHYYIYKT